jgi:hypothetical protein
MTIESNKQNAAKSEVTLKQYQPPNFADYGKMSELTQADPGPGVGCDGTYPSYTASI